MTVTMAYPATQHSPFLPALQVPLPHRHRAPYPRPVSPSKPVPPWRGLALIQLLQFKAPHLPTHIRLTEGICLISREV